MIKKMGLLEKNLKKMSNSNDGCGCVMIMLGIVLILLTIHVLKHGIKITYSHPDKNLTTTQIKFNSG
jgi:hypothetical protein